MSEQDNDLIEKAKQFEALVQGLENKQVVFSKKQLENYHAKMEGEMDEKMIVLEDAIIKDTSQPSKESYYTKLFSFLKGWTWISQEEECHH